MSWLSESCVERPAGLESAGVAAEFMYESGEEFKAGTEFADRVDVEYDDEDPDDMPRTVTELYAECELDACACSTAGDSAG